MLPPKLGIGALLLAASLLVAPQGAVAQELVPVPDLEARVTDLTGTLEPAQADALEAKLVALEEETGTQIAVLLVPTVRPEAIEQFALRVVEAWRLGREDVDDGALLLVALEEREVRIEVGYGLEGALTDATSNRIIDEAILPHFRTGDMYGGLAAGVDRMIAVARGEELPPPEQPAPAPRSVVPFAFVVFVMAMVVGGILSALIGRVGGAAATGGLTGVIVFALSSALGTAVLTGFGAFILTLVFGGRRGRRSHRAGGLGGLVGLAVLSRGGGGFGGGGFGGGGFGGFSGGGGGFGGGGASGGW